MKDASLKSASAEALTNDMLANPTLYRLILMVSDTGVDVVIKSRIEDNGIIHRRIDFNPGAEPVAALEEAVYENPLLTADFHATDVIVDNNRFFLMSHADATEEETARRIALLWPYDRTGIEYQAFVSPVEDGRTVMVTAVDRKLAAFLRRTWGNPRVIHRLGIAARYYAFKNKLGNMGKIHVRLAGGRTDVVALGRDGIMLVNSFETPSVDDAAYYTLGCAKYLDYDNDTDRILAGGDAALRDEYLALMRRFATYVVPEIIPPEINAVSKNIPFEALLLPLV